MNNKLKYLVIAILGALLIIYFYNKYRVAPGLDLSKLSLTDLDGKPVKIENFKGRKIILTFGASWCGNCISEMKVLNSIKDTELRDVEIICVSDEPLETIRSFRERKAYPFTFLKLDQSFQSIGINSIPTNYILNNDLDVKYEKVGEIDWKDFSTREHLKKIMDN
jgi:peroxiredoxin